MSVERVTYRLGDADLILETGKIGKQANGCVYAQWGGAAIIATICASSAVTEGQDFVPVTVEYNEKFYAAGKITGKKSANSLQNTYLCAPVLYQNPQDAMRRVHTSLSYRGG